MTAVRRRLGPRRKSISLWATLALMAAAMVVVLSAAATSLPGSNFEIDNDANLKVDGPSPAIDWLNSAGTAMRSGVTVKPDAPTGATDDSFGQGTKEDTAVPTVVSGSIPPNKSDLLNFGVYLETTASGARFLNLFWHRVQEPVGTTNMDFEFNKSSTLSANGVTPVRLAGDLLIQYDLAQGGTNPQLFVSTWVASGPSSQCEAANSTPCWGTKQNFSATGDATGTINTSAIPASESGGLGSISPRTFGEAQLDFDALTGGGCTPFGSAYLKSRASDSFTSALKDFIAPAQLNLSNCGTITIIKHTNPGGLDQNFSFASTIAGSQLSCTTDTTPASFTLNDAGTDTETCTNVPIGSYTVTEGANPTGFAFASLTCQSTGSGTGSQDGTIAKQANIAINAGGDTVTCTYVNNQQLGAIKISKTSSKSTNGLAGATFSITSGGNPISGSPFTTDANGEICVDGLVFGDYVVTETAAPPGYARDDTTGHTVTVDNNTSCSADPYVGESIGFTDTPLADIQVRFRDGGSGETALDQALSCTNATGTSSTADTTGWDDTLTVSGVKIGSSVVTITCTIAIDP